MPISHIVDPLNVPETRRNTSRRAKSKASNIAQLLTQPNIGGLHEGDMDEGADFGNSDSDDPAWTPQDDKVKLNDRIYKNFNLIVVVVVKNPDWCR
jgi:hypothetical protein